jgi:hypothetical protein
VASRRVRIASPELSFCSDTIKSAPRGAVAI